MIKRIRKFLLTGYWSDVAAFLLILLSGLHSSQSQTITLRSPNVRFFDGFGGRVAEIPDVNGDGFADVAVTDSGQYVYIFDSMSGWLLHQFVSPQDGFLLGGFGCSISGIPDVNGNGSGDIVIGSCCETHENSSSMSGLAYVFDGATGALLHTLSPRPESGIRFGSKVCGISDVNGDGRGDVLVGARKEEGLEGRVHLFDGRTGGLIRTFAPPHVTSASTTLFGWSLSVIPISHEMDRPEIIVGAIVANNADPQPSKREHVYVFDVESGEVKLDLVSPYGSVKLAFGVPVSGVPDVTGDGHGDLLVGSRFESPGTSPDKAGRAYLFDGANGALLQTLKSPNEQETGYFGVAVAGIPDINEDGCGELVVGAPGEAPSASSPNAAGGVYVFDGATGENLEILLPPYEQPSAYFGYSLSPIANNAGGEVFFVVGEPYGTGNGLPIVIGQAHIYSLQSLVASSVSNWRLSE